MLIHGTMGRASEKRATQSAKHAEQERKVRQEEYRRIGRSVACGLEKPREREERIVRMRQSYEHVCKLRRPRMPCLYRHTVVGWRSGLSVRLRAEEEGAR